MDSVPFSSGPRFAAERLTADFGFYLRTAQTLASEHSPFQHIEIMEHALFGRLMRIDGCFMTSERDEFFYHEPMVHLPAIAHGHPRSALIVGGGDGGAAEELLKYPGMERVVLAELDGAVVRLAREWLPSIHGQTFEDPRLELRLGDARAFIDAPGERFDQIILDLTDPIGPALDLYTVEFYEACRRSLNPGGVLSMHWGSPIHLGDSMARIAASLRAVFPIVRPYLQYVPLYGTLWCMGMASDSTDPLTLSRAEVDARIVQHSLQGLQLYNGDTHHALLAQPNYLRDLLARPAQPIHLGAALPEAIDTSLLPEIEVRENLKA